MARAVAVVRRLRNDTPQFVFAAFTGIDKSSHASGHTGALVHEALATIDNVVAEIRHDAERAGRWDHTHLWIVSDHGHSAVAHHDDLAVLFDESWGFRTLAHPWTLGAGHEVAVMVSGNAMAHIYLELTRRQRPYWPALRSRWSGVADALLARPPGLRVLFTSGYGQEQIARRGVSPHGVNFIPKPYGPTALSERVRQLLEFEPSTPGTGPVTVMGGSELPS